MASKQKRDRLRDIINRSINGFSGISARKAQINWKIVGLIVLVIIIIVVASIILSMMKRAGIWGSG